LIQSLSPTSERASRPPSKFPDGTQKDVTSCLPPGKFSNDCNGRRDIMSPDPLLSLGFLPARKRAGGPKPNPTDFLEPDFLIWPGTCYRWYVTKVFIHNR
jgi:hypothetical protein